MKIKRLEIKNYKGIEVFDLEVDQDTNTIVVAGENGSGKSSSLDAIYAVAAGKKGAIATHPIRDGERKADVKATLDNGLILHRKWSGERTTLEVTSADNAKYGTPQKVLDGFISALSFDPLEFANMGDTPKGARQQLRTLLELVELPFDLDENDAERKRAYDARTYSNREVDRLGAELDTLASVPSDTPDEEYAVTTLVGELQTLQQEAQLRETLLAEYKKHSDEIQALTERNVAIAIQGRELSDDPAARERLVGQIEHAEETNGAVRTKRRRAVLLGEYDSAVAETHEAERRLQELDSQKTEGMAGARFPVEGLGFNDDGVLFEGHPLSDISAAERLKVSVGMAMAMNPDLRVILLRDASLLSPKSLKMIEELTGTHEYQVWYEIVGDEVANATITMVEGRIRE